MALYIKNYSVCPICGFELLSHQDVVPLPAFSVLPDDLLNIFSDSTVHKNCLDSHPLASALENRVNEWACNTGPGKRICKVCECEVLDPDDYILIDHLTYDESSLLFRFNYTHLHKSHINLWPEREEFCNLVTDILTKDNPGSEYVDYLIDSLCSSLTK